MLRISEIGSRNGDVILKLEGRLVGPWIGELAEASSRVLNADRALKLVLTDVAYVDREGVKLLLTLQNRRAILEGMSPFVLEELKEAARAAKTPSTKQ
jgi:hypothetical protein